MLKLDPDYLPALTLNVRILLDQQKPETALSFAEKIIQLEPDNPEHKLLKALVLGNLNRREEAIRLVEGVIQSVSPKSRQHRVASKLLGLFLMAEGEPDAAAEVLSQSYLNDPELAQGNRTLAEEAYQQKASQALAQDDFKTAMKAIDQALELAGNTSEGVNFQQRLQLSLLRARILAQAGRMDAAITALQALRNQRPDNMETVVTLASLCAAAGKWDLLRDVLPDIATQPELQDISFYLEGRIALAEGRAGAAREAFEQAFRVLPDGAGKLRASLEFYQGVCLLKIDRVAEGDMKIINSLDSGFRPETSEEAILASRSLLRAGQFQEAIPLLEALTLNRVADSIEVWNLLGRAHQANGSTTLAISAFNQSLSVQPSQSDVLALRGSLLRSMGDLQAAAIDFQNALNLDFANPALAYGLGLIYLQMGELEDARHWIGESAAKMIETPGIHLLHALLAYNTQAVDEARSALKIYFQLVPERTNESAFYLEYILIAMDDSIRAMDTLSRRIDALGHNTLVGNFRAYILEKLDRKAVLDAAGYADTPEDARRQLCEAAYWLAQHARTQDQSETSRELLELAVQIGSPDYPEYQFARWQLQRLQ